MRRKLVVLSLAVLLLTPVIAAAEVPSYGWIYTNAAVPGEVPSLGWSWSAMTSWILGLS